MITGNEDLTACKLLPVEGSSSCLKQIVWQRTKYITVFPFCLSLNILGIISANFCTFNLFLNSRPGAHQLIILFLE